MSENEIRVLYVQPGKYPEERIIPNTLSASQKLVGGNIECCCPWRDNWTRCGDNPIIANTPNGWDSAFCADPCIVQDKDRWVMFYYGYNGEHAQEGIAFSEDLLHWKKENAPILCQPAHVES